MIPIGEEEPLVNPDAQELTDPLWTDQPLLDQRTPFSASPAPDLNAPNERDGTDPDMLRQTLAALVEGHADRFDPVRFRFIEAMVQKALKQRPSVARVIEKKARQALFEYMGVYVPAREHAASLVARMASEASEATDEVGCLFDAGDFKGVGRLAARIDGHENKKQGVLAALSGEMLQRGETGEFAPKPSFEDELRQQEREVMQSVAGYVTGGAGGAGTQQGQGGSGELSAMRCFRESLVQRNSERRVACVIQDGPENPGPLNSQALIIRSLSMMRDLSPSYTNRFISYMDTLLWLEQAGGAAAPPKSKGAGRRKS